MTAAPILDCPIISVNVRVWHFWSFVLKHDAMRYISIIPVGVMNVFMFADLYRAWGNIDEVIINAYFAMIFFNAVVGVEVEVTYLDDFKILFDFSCEQFSYCAIVRIMRISCNASPKFTRKLL